MKLHIMADIHGEFEGRSVFHDIENPLRACLTKVSSDVVILAGDVHVGIDSVKLAAEFWPDRQVVMVAGNHEFYHHEYHQTLLDLRQESAKYPNVHFLENNIIELNGVVFLGCTLWTDFCLYGQGKEQTCQFEAKQQMADYKLIRNGLSGNFLLNPKDTAVIHNQSIEWLNDSLVSICPEKKVVVVTHTAPSEHSIPEQYQGRVLSSAFASNLEWLIEKYQPELWVHGHTHGYADYMIGDTRVVANQKGYPSEDTDFKPELIVEL